MTTMTRLKGFATSSVIFRVCGLFFLHLYTIDFQGCCRMLWPFASGDAFATVPTQLKIRYILSDLFLIYSSSLMFIIHSTIRSFTIFPSLTLPSFPIVNQGSWSSEEESELTASELRTALHTSDTNIQETNGIIM